MSSSLLEIGGPSGHPGLEPVPKRVLLISPPRFNELIGKNPAIVEKHRGFNPPLGVLMLGGYLQEHSVHSVEIIDAQPYEYTYELSLIHI